MGSKEDLFFGRLAVKRKLVSQEQLNRCLALQAGTKAPKSLLQLLVDAKHLTPAQMTELLNYQRQLKAAMIGPYRILGVLGKGGMGSVYKGIVPATGLKVAIKVLPSRLSSDEVLRARFVREAELGMKLDHPNIVHTYDIGQQQKFQYIALEYINGGDLLRRAKAGPIDEREALRIISQMCKALQHAHSRGMIHRDIKPSNILFDQQNVAKLTDFGLAILNATPAARVTQPGQVVGTPSYISPEQAHGSAEIDIRSDIYSLGATLYRIATGKLPFEGNPIEVAAMHINAPLVPPGNINPRLSDPCCKLICKMMAKKPEDRFGQPGEVYAEIDRILRQSQSPADSTAVHPAGGTGMLASLGTSIQKMMHSPPPPPPAEQRRKTAQNPTTPRVSGGN